MWTSLVYLIFASAPTVVLGKQEEVKFDHHPNNSTSWYVALYSYLGRSSLDCLVRCSQSTACKFVAVCPGNSLQRVTCSLFSNVTSSSQVAGVAISPFCRIFKTKEPEPLICVNGGTNVGGRCVCPIQYSGLTCQRLIRDCTEAVENGYNSSFNGVYQIQPSTTQAPFKVLCDFSYGGVTRALFRSTTSFSANWTVAKAGFGDSPTNDFFIGLNNLHHLTIQASYNQHIFIMYNNYVMQGSAFYDDFTIGNETSSYAVTYSNYFTTSNVADNGLAGPFPVVFSTLDHDNNGCAVAKGYPGWFGPKCSGTSMFATTLNWPVNGAAKTLNMLTFFLVRKSPFYF